MMDARDGQRPPGGARRLLRGMRIYDTSYECAGDLEEEYSRILQRSGRREADRWYWWQVLASLPRYLVLASYWWMVMLGSYVRSTLRNMRHNKGYTGINVLSLVLGLVCAQLIFIYVFDEISYDRFHEDRERIFKVYSREEATGGETRINNGSYFPLSAILQSELPAVDLGTRYYPGEGMTLAFGEKQGIACREAYVDEQFFSIFSFPVLGGNSDDLFPDRDSIVISRSMSERLFGGQNGRGRTVRTNDGRDLLVTGVIDDVPRNSSLRFDCVMPFKALFRSGVEPDHWGGNPFSTFVLLDKGQEVADIESLITGIVEVHNPTENSKVEFLLQPLTMMHLYQPAGGGLIRILVIFVIIAVAVLAIACINFINLNTARASTRMREVVMRKVLGAGKGDLVEQFIGESMLITAMALVISTVLVSLSLPYFNRILGKDLSLDMILTLPVITGFVAITLVTGLASGIYPALCLSEAKTVHTLKGSARTVTGKAGLRKALVVTQFALSIFMMIATLGIYRQLDYILNKDLGYESDAVLTVRASGETRQDLEVLRGELLSRPGVRSVSSSLQHPVEIGSTVSNADWPGRGPDRRVVMHWDRVGYDYFETFGMEIIEGRAFSEEFPSDVQGAYIVNEEAVRRMGVESPIGMEMSVFNKKGTIIGVVRDFHFQPLYSGIEPFVFMLSPGSRSFLYVRVDSDSPETVASVLDCCRDYDPDATYGVMLFDDIMMDYIYTSERKMKEMALYFTGFALLIACMGLLGLSSFLAEKRRKEISIRRVLGASLSELTILFVREFTLWVVLAWAIALPAGYFVMRSFLSGYAYHFDPDLTLFVIPGAAALIISLSMVGIHGLKTSCANPADILRSE